MLQCYIAKKSQLLFTDHVLHKYTYVYLILSVDIDRAKLFRALFYGSFNCSTCHTLQQLNCIKSKFALFKKGEIQKLFHFYKILNNFHIENFIITKFRTLSSKVLIKLYYGCSSKMRLKLWIDYSKF